MSSDALFNAAYESDPRVAAGRAAPWFIGVSPTGGHVAIKVPTADYAALANFGWCPEEVDELEGGAVKPLVAEEELRGCNICAACRGKLAMFGSCRTCWNTGRELHRVTYDPPILAEGAEDRLYRPFKLVAFPARSEPCPTCSGTGSHVDPGIDAGGLSDDDFREDPEFRRDYFAGRYDVTCFECKGARAVVVVDEERLDEGDRRLYDAWRALEDERARERAYDEAERAAERRMGC